MVGHHALSATSFSRKQERDEQIEKCLPQTIFRSLDWQPHLDSVLPIYVSISHEMEAKCVQPIHQDGVGSVIEQVVPMEENGVPYLCRKKIWRKRGRAKMGLISTKSSRKVATSGTLH